MFYHSISEIIQTVPDWQVQPNLAPLEPAHVPRKISPDSTKSCFVHLVRTGPRQSHTEHHDVFVLTPSYGAQELRPTPAQCPVNKSTISTASPLQSSRNVDKQACDYYDEGADCGSTVLENLQPYGKYRIRPRFPRDISLIETSCPLFGAKSPISLIVAPTAMQCLAHSDGEVAIAGACRQAGIVIALSSFATSTLEQVATAGGSNPRVLQLYLLKERELQKVDQTG